MIKTAEKYLFADTDQKLALMDYYNKHCFELVKKSRRYRIQPNDNWCAMFTSVVAHKMAIPDNLFPYEVSVQEQINLSKERGFYGHDWELLRVGDLVCFDWNRDGWADHVGIVAKIDRNLITTIEGNIHGTVNYRTVANGSKAVAGFILVDREPEFIKIK